MGLRDFLPPVGASPNADGSFRDVYLVMDFMATDLHYIIQSAAQGKNQLTDDHVQCFIYQILRGVYACHTAQVLHRDLKPANVLVNQNCELRIADFGLARGVDAAPHSPRGALTEYVVTRWYRAPELLAGNEAYGAPIDMWSVGCILGELLGLAPLFPGRDILSQLRLAVGTLGVSERADLSWVGNPKAAEYIRALAADAPPPPPLEERFPRAPPAALDLLRRLLAFDPADRLSAADALRHAYLAPLHALNEEPAAPPFDFAFEGASDAQLRELLAHEVRRFHPELLAAPPPPLTPTEPPRTPPTQPATPDEGSTRDGAAAKRARFGGAAAP